MVITAAKAVFDSKGELIGVAALDMLLEDLKGLVSETRVTDSGYVFIINGDGKYIVHPGIGHDGFDPFLSKAESGELAEGYRRMMNGERGFRLNHIRRGNFVVPSLSSFAVERPHS